MIEPGEQRPGAADQDGVPVVGDPAGRERWEQTRRALTVQPPPLATILVRARTTRRRALATVAAVAAVCATMVVVPLVGSLRADDRGPAGRQTPISTSVTTPTSSSRGSNAPDTRQAPPETAPAATVVGLSLSDPQHGFAISQQCDEISKPGARCRYGVWNFDATVPQHWTALPSPVPDGSADNGWSGDLVAFSTDRVVIHSVTGDRQRSAWFSADGGLTWSQTTRRTQLTTIPTGGRPTVECTAVSADLGCSRSDIVVDLPDGSWGTLAAPTGVTPSSVGPAPDGRWWLVGTRGSNIVAGPSPDGGRNWSLTAVGRGPETAFHHQLAFSGTSTVWVETIGQHPDDDVKNGLLAIRRSVDSGRTWQSVWTASSGTEPRSQVGAALTGTSSLQLCTELGEPYRVDANGRSTELGAGCSSGGWRERTSWGYLEHTSGATSPGRTSTDGARWTVLPEIPES